MSSEKDVQPAVKEPRPAWIKHVLVWVTTACCLVFVISDIYLRNADGTRALDPIVNYVYGTHRQITIPLTAGALILLLVVDRISSKRDPKLGISGFWKVVSIIVLALLTYVSAQGFLVR